MARAIIATIGEDRPGLVKELSQIVHEMNLNIEDSRMAVLGGEFAVLMSVTGGSVSLDMLEARVKELSDTSGLAYLFRTTTERESTQVTACVVKVEAMDHPGIVHKVAGFFSERGINIGELETQTEHAAHTGTPIFNLSMKVEVPTDTDIVELSDAFYAFCEDRNLDGAVQAPSSIVTSK